MKHTYHIHGMSCNGCKSHVHEALSGVEGITNVVVDLEKGEAEIEMIEHIPIELLQKALDQLNGNYSIHQLGESGHHHKAEEKKPKPTGKGVYYCPMRCEGDKTYSKPGDCPVCGMDLVKEVSAGEEESEEEDTVTKLTRKFVIAVAFTLPIFIISMSDMVPGNPIYNWMDRYYWDWVQLALSIPVVFYATWMFFQRAYSSIIRWNPNMFTLIGIGAGVSWTFSIIALLFPSVFPDQFKTEAGTVHVYFEASTVILTLVLLGQLLEARAHKMTNSAVKELLKLAPSKAIKVESGEDIEISIDAINPGDILKVKPGAKVPVDGKITEGNAAIDESMITGEAIPVEKEKGDEVTSGTINGSTVFLMKAERVGADTLLSQIIEMVNKASQSRAPIQKTVDIISSWFVPSVVAVSLITFVIWLIWGPDPAMVYAFVNAIAVLIIACPCALGLASPMSVMVGMGKGAREGVLIKNAESLEALNEVDVLIIDKTGTVTEGKPSVSSVFATGMDEDKFLSIVAAVNQNSGHPLADAMLNKAKEKGLNLQSASDFNSVSGAGVTATLDGQRVAIGNHSLMEKEGVEMKGPVVEHASKMKEDGKTVPFVSIDGKLVGCVMLSDEIKPSAKKSIQNLKNLGIEIIMMTGDNESTAKLVSNKVGIDQYFANCLPEDKRNKVQELQKSGKKVAMAGDGVNDAPALAQADVGIAMGTGTDVAIESAEVTLVKGDLHGIVKAANLSKAVIRNIRQNLFFALIYNTVGIPIAAGLLFPFFGILLSPMIAALAMSFSSVSVITNALRLRTVKIS